MNCSLFYNVNKNNLANEKLNRYNEFRSVISQLNNDSLTDEDTNKLDRIIKSCQCNEDRVSLLKSIPINKTNIYTSLLIFETIIYDIATKYQGEPDIYGSSCHILNEFENIIKSDNELINNSKLDRVISSIGHIVNTVERLSNNKTGDYVYYLSPKTLHSVASINESQTNTVSDVKIKSSNSPNGKFTGVDVSEGVNPSEYLIDLVNEEDEDYFNHKIKFLYEYLLSLKGNFDDNNTSAFIEILNYVFSKVIDDITGKEILIDIISNVISY